MKNKFCYVLLALIITACVDQNTNNSNCQKLKERIDSLESVIDDFNHLVDPRESHKTGIIKNAPFKINSQGEIIRNDEWASDFMLFPISGFGNKMFTALEIKTEKNGQMVLDTVAVPVVNLLSNQEVSFWFHYSGIDPVVINGSNGPYVIDLIHQISPCEEHDLSTPCQE